MQSVDASPNVGKSLMALRHLGYANEAAIGDLIDNSIDAESNKVKVFIHNNAGEVTITVGDAGKGMDAATLNQALRLGSDINHDPTKDLGFYGMGLVTAAISMGRRITVVTRQNGKTMLAATEDLDEMSAANKFEIMQGEADESHQEIYRHVLGAAKSGTVVQISKCDAIKHPEDFVTRTTAYIARTFRLFLPLIDISVNNKKVAPFDPMYAEAGGKLEYDQPIQVLGRDVRVRLWRLPDAATDANTANQGFALLRNAREIGYGHWWGLWGEKHPDLNRVRGEIYFPADLDDAFGVDFTKQTPKLTGPVVEALRDKLYPEISRLKSSRAAAKRVEKAATTAPQHSVAERAIARAVPAAPALALAGAKGGETRPDGRRKKAAAVEGPPAKFNTASMTAAGPIYDTSIVNGVLNITWNIDHEFYARFIAGNASTMTAADMLIYALAKAETDTRTDAAKTVWVDIRANVSSTLRGILAMK